MSQESRDMETMRRKMIAAVDKLSPEDIKSMVLANIKLANTYELKVMAEATSFKNFDTLDFELDLTE